MIRNFAIIAHVDHGKSTLSDRFLEITGTVDRRSLVEQILDSNPIGREHGVTIQLAPVTMRYKMTNDESQMTNGKNIHSSFDIRHSEFLLNLIDTPGHVDFSYEVERSLAACEGAILLVDATQGVQAQTIAHAQKAMDLNLTIIPALNKIDLPNAEIDRCIQELSDTFGFNRDDISLVSAKTGKGVPELLADVIRDVPAPSDHMDAPLRALVFTSMFDPHLGVIAYVRIVDGTLEKNDAIQFMVTNQTVIPKELGIFTPSRHPVSSLSAGYVGYIATGLKDIHSIHVGDTVTLSAIPASPAGGRYPLSAIFPLPGYRRPTPMVFANVFPGGNTTYRSLLDAVEKLRLSDASLTSSPVHSPILGPGLQMGFLGLFHMAITKERLDREYATPTTLTTPTVEYLIHLNDGSITTVRNPNDFPDPNRIKQVLEPVCLATVITPADSIGPLMRVLENRRGQYQNTSYLGSRARLSYLVPLAELVSGLFDKIKSASHGFASLDYELADPQPVDAVKLELLVHHDPVEPLSRIVVRDQAVGIGRAMAEKFKALLPAQQFSVPIQAAVGGTILARETKPAFRKDVTAKLYGGDQTRKDKLLKKQKKGKKKMARIGNVNIPDDVLTQMALS